MHEKKVYDILKFYYIWLPSKLKIKFLMILLGTFIIGILELLMLTTFAKLLNNDSSTSILNIILINNIFTLDIEYFFGLLVIFVGTGRIYLFRLLNQLSFNTGHFLGVEIFNKTFSQKYEELIGKSSSEYIAIISTKVDNVVYDLFLPTLNLISSLIILVFLSVFLFYNIDSSFIIYCIPIIGVYALILLFTRKKLDYLSNQYRLLTAEKISVISQAIGHSREIALGFFKNTFHKSFKNIDTKKRNSEFISQSISIIPKFVIESLVLLSIIIFYDFKTSSYFDLSKLAALVAAMQRALPLFQQTYASFVSLKNVSHVASELINIIQDQFNDANNKFDNIPFSFNRFELKNVFFKYKGSTSTDILKNLNIEISKGDIIAIIGKSGSGKSSLIDIILGLLSPTSGEMLLNGRRYNYNELDFWRDTISIVPQIIYLSNDTVINNITLGSEDIDWNLLNKCMHASDLIETMQNNSNFLHRHVGENGIYLSGGQRQKISIARALYLSRGILILDEATSNLDKESEEKIIQRIFENFIGITIIIVTHRMKEISYCNKIFKIENCLLNKESTI
jgi:ATP-binding cassette subfamily B protein